MPTPIDLSSIYGLDDASTRQRLLRDVRASASCDPDIERRAADILSERMVRGQGLSRVGLVEDVLSSWEDELRGFYDEMGLLGVKLWHGSGLGDREVRQYAAFMPLMGMLYRRDLEGLTVVEVGTDIPGIGFLAYLSAQGADVHAVDVNGGKPREYAKRMGVHFMHGKWEELSRHLDDEGVKAPDIILTNSICPVAWAEDRKLMSRYEDMVTSEMERCLSPDGIYINNYDIGRDYYLTGVAFGEAGFARYYFRLNDSWTISVFQRPSKKGM